jgi:hypothetical protein
MTVDMAGAVAAGRGVFDGGAARLAQLTLEWSLVASGGHLQLTTRSRK